MSSLRIYLSGSIRKGNTDERDESSYWTKNHESEISSRLSDFDVKLLNPANYSFRRNDFYANYGCDLYLVSMSDCILVDLREAKGIGVGAEMMFARERGIPCFGWLPKKSHYHRMFLGNVFGEDLVDWTHPFAHGLTVKTGESIEELAGLVREFMYNQGVASLPSPENAIDYFCRLYPDFQI